MAGLDPIWTPLFLRTASAWNMLGPTMQPWLVEPLALSVHQPLDCPCHHHRAQACPPAPGQASLLPHQGTCSGRSSQPVLYGQTFRVHRGEGGEAEGQQGRQEQPHVRHFHATDFHASYMKFSRFANINTSQMAVCLWLISKTLIFGGFCPAL